GADVHEAEIAALALDAQLQLEAVVAELEQVADERPAAQRERLSVRVHVCIMRVFAHVLYSRCLPVLARERPMPPRTRTVPRKMPKQQRSKDTVDVILAATARVL